MPVNAYPNVQGTQSIATASGAAWDSIFIDLLEHVPELIWPSSNYVYGRMRRDPQLTGVLAAYTLPLRRATWAVDQAGARPDVAAAVATDLGLPLLADKGGRRQHKWTERLRLALLELVFGHMGFAKSYDVTGARAVLARMDERMPTSIADIRVDDQGDLAAIVQYPRGRDRQGPTITRDELVWFAHEREGSAWQGQSMLRPSYGPWLLKHEMMRVLATSSRRFGMGVPTVEAPAGATPAQIADANAMASKIRVGDQSGAGMPNGFRLSLQGLQGSVPDTLGFIRYLDQQMSRSSLATILDLGDTPNGSRALGDTVLDLLLMSLQSIADEVADVFTNDVARDIVTLNWGEDEPCPVVVCGDVGASHVVTAESLALLLQHGALLPDPALESFVRREWKLPQRETPAPVVQETVPPIRAGRPVKAASPTVTLRRQPTAVEAAAKTDFVTVQQQWLSAVETLTSTWQSTVTPTQVDSLVTQVEAAVTAGDAAALGALTVDPTPGVQILVSAMRNVAAQGAKDAAAEAAAQDVTVTPATVDTATVDQVAEVTAALLGSGLSSAAARAALQHWGPNMDAATVSGAVRTQLESLTGSSLADGIGSALSNAQNIGRVATLQSAPEAAYYASEILDDNTCDACQEVDGTEFASLTDAEDAYASGGYSGCEGGLRCRGIIVAVWSDAAKQAA